MGQRKWRLNWQQVSTAHHDYFMLCYLTYVILGPAGTRCGNILDSLVQNAEQRELLRRMLDRDKERYRQEDKEIEIKMAEQGIR